MILSKSENIEQKILDNIYSGRYADKLPSEKDLAKIYKTTPVTAAKILNRLKEKKIVNRISGRGTYINPEGLRRKVKMHLSLPQEIMEELEPELKRKFPEIEFEFPEKKSRGIERLAEDSDIIYLTSYFPDSYDKYFAPLPEELLNEFLDEDKYYSGTFLAHNQNHSFYGVPYCASPCILTYNKELLLKYFGAIPGKPLSLDDLFDINRKLEKEDIALFDCNKFRKATVIDFIFSQMEENEIDRRNLNGISRESLSEGLKKVEELLKDSIEKGLEFIKGKTVFSRVCRQTLRRRHFDSDFQWDVLPGSFGESSLSILASESLFVSAKAPNREKLFEVCRAFLDPEIQSIIGKHKYGIPTLKSAALNSMDSRKFRDDVFFNEMNNVVFKYELFEKPLMNSFVSGIEDFFRKKISFEDFLARTERLYALNKESLKTKDRFANENNF